MESVLRLFSTSNPSKDGKNSNLADSEPAKCLARLFRTSEIEKSMSKSDIASTYADDTMSTMSSVISSPKQFFNKVARCQKQVLDVTFTLKDIATKRKYIKRIEEKQIFADVPVKKVKKPQEEQEAKQETQPEQQSNGLMLVWEDGQAKIIDVQEQSQFLLPAPSSLKSQKHTTSHSFKKLNHANQWTASETKKFYRALEIFGTDFSMIAMMFPLRNRLQIKNKFIKEEKLNPELLNEKLVRSSKNDRSRLRIFRKVNLLKDNLSNNEQTGKTIEGEIQVRQRAESFNSICSTNEIDNEIIGDLTTFLGSTS